MRDDPATAAGTFRVTSKGTRELFCAREGTGSGMSLRERWEPCGPLVEPNVGNLARAIVERKFVATLLGDEISSPQHRPMSLLGTTIGRIRLVDRLGEGGMGEVFVGYDQTLDRRVAVKCVRVGDRPRKIKGRFLQEARILSRLDHPNICQIYDFVEREDRDFLVMELVEGESLEQAARSGLDDKAKLKVASQPPTPRAWCTATSSPST